MLHAIKQNGYQQLAPPKANKCLQEAPLDGATQGEQAANDSVHAMRIERGSIAARSVPPYNAKEPRRNLLRGSFCLARTPPRACVGYGTARPMEADRARSTRARPRRTAMPLKSRQTPQGNPPRVLEPSLRRFPLACAENRERRAGEHRKHKGMNTENRSIREQPPQMPHFASRNSSTIWL